MGCTQVIARYSRGDMMRNVYVDIVAKNFYPVKQKKTKYNSIIRRRKVIHFV